MIKIFYFFQSLQKNARLLSRQRRRMHQNSKYLLAQFHNIRVKAPSAINEPARSVHNARSTLGYDHGHFQHGSGECEMSQRHREGKQGLL